MKFLRVLCVIALVAFFAASAYAETQNVKVSGDLAVRSFFRDNYGINNQSLTASPNENTLGIPGTNGFSPVARSNSNWFYSTTELQVDADLTDNVSTCIRLLNQRDWNVASTDSNVYVAGSQTSTYGSGGFGHNVAYQQGGLLNNTYDEFGVDLELAYITLKNFLYSPLTVTIGRQNLWFGKGFIVGANQRVQLGQPISAPEYTALNAFDSVKAVLDFDPWTITGIYSKIWQNDIQADDGLDLWGTNVGYKFDAYKGEAEAYWFLKRDEQVRPMISKTSNEIHTIGIRGSFDPIDILTVYGEFAGQFGNYSGNSMQLRVRDRVAGALDIGADCRYFTDKWNWKPKFGIEYIWYSGDQGDPTVASGSGQYNGWDPMFRGKTDSLIREFIGRYYFTAKYPFSPNNYYNTADNSFQNQHQLIFKGTLQPMDSLKLNGNLNMFWNQETYTQNFGNDVQQVLNTMKNRGYVGTELDLGATWDYTEDVSFNLAAGWFLPGPVYNNDDTTAATATDFVGSVKVSF